MDGDTNFGSRKNRGKKTAVSSDLGAQSTLETLKVLAEADDDLVLVPKTNAKLIVDEDESSFTNELHSMLKKVQKNKTPIDMGGVQAKFESFIDEGNTVETNLFSVSESIASSSRINRIKGVRADIDEKKDRVKQPLAATDAAASVLETISHPVSDEVDARLAALSSKFAREEDGPLEGDESKRVKIENNEIMEVKPEMEVEKNGELKQEQAAVDLGFQEVSFGSLAGCLSFLDQAGELQSKKNATIHDDDDDVLIQYRDENGKERSIQEEWKAMSRKFQGINPSLKAKEKEIQRAYREKKLQQASESMSSTQKLLSSSKGG